MHTLSCRVCARACVHALMPQQLEHTHACGRVAMSTMGGGPLAPRRPVNADKQAGSSAFAGSMRSGSSGYLRDPARAPNGLLARRGRDRAPKQDCRAVALTFPCHAVEAGRASQFSKSPERRTMSFARLLAVWAAARASPGEREGTGAAQVAKIFSAGVGDRPWALQPCRQRWPAG